MAENSAIEWTDHTFNPWMGCTKVSDGCKHCYAETLMDKRYGKVQWGPQGTRVRTSAANWRKPLAWNRKAQAEGRRYRVFCASLADVFEYKLDQRREMDEWRYDLFNLIQNTPNLDWLLLTKRPELVNETIERVTGFSDSEMWFYSASCWIGTSVENQEQADKRIPELLGIPAAVRFLSMEPLLGPVNLKLGTMTVGISMAGHLISKKFIDWIIVGGESGTGARPMHPDWARSLRDQCNDAAVPFFFKQWGEWLPFSQCRTAEQRDAVSKTTIRNNNLADGPATYFGQTYRHAGGHIVSATTTGIRPEQVNRVGKKVAGRLLDGREWSEFPHVIN